MIVDTIDNAHLYTAKDTPLAKAIEYLKETDFSKIDPGRYDIDGDNIYVMVQEYDSRPLEGAEFEAHRDYADVHFVRQGDELMGYMNIKKLTTTEPYDAENDCEMLKGDVDIVTLFAGMFAVVYPKDAHIPCLAIDEPAPIKKVVIKIRM